MGYECEPAKILVLSQEDAILSQGKLHHIFVHGTLLELAHGEDIVTM